MQSASIFLVQVDPVCGGDGGCKVEFLMELEWMLTIGVDEEKLSSWHLMLDGSSSSLYSVAWLRALCSRCLTQAGCFFFFFFQFSQ